MVKRFLFLILLIGCAEKKAVLPEGEEKIIDRTQPSRPSWVTVPPRDTEEFYFSVGVKTSAPTLEGGETDARMDAGRKFVERLFGVEFAGVYKGIRKNYEKEIYDEISGKSAGKIAGARIKEVYWEKYQKWIKGKVSYGYNVWVLVEISKSATKRMLEEELKKMNSMLNLAREVLAETEKMEGKAALVRLKDVRGRIASYEVPEAIELISRMDERIRKLETSLKSVAVFVSDATVRASALNILREHNFYCVEMAFSHTDKRLLLQRTNEKGLRYAFVEEMNVQEEKASGYFIFARATGKFDMIDAETGETVFSIPFNERAAGTDFNTASRNAMNFVARRINQLLPEKLVEMFGGNN